MSPNNPFDELPMAEMYQNSYDLEEWRAYQRMKSPGAQTLGEAPTAPPAPQEPKPVSVDISEEGLAQSADQAALLEERRDKISGELKTPTVRRALNKVFSTITGGVLSVDAIEEHITAQMENRPSPLVEKLKSSEILSLLDPVGNTVEELVRDQLKREGTMDPELQGRISGTAGLIAGLLTPGGFGKKASKKAGQVIMASMFSNPATHAANVSGNALLSAWAVPERFLSATASALEYGITLGAHERKVFFGESGAQIFGGVSALWQAIREAGHVMMTGESRVPTIMEDIMRQTTLTGKPKMRLTAEGELKMADKELLEESVLGQGIGWWTKIWNSPVHALGAEDAGSFMVNYWMEAYAQAYREAARTGNVSWKELGRLIDNPSPEVVMRARQFATAHTLNRQLHELGPLAQKFGEEGYNVQDMSYGAIPLGRLVVPVLRTPINGAHFAIERAPGLNFLSSTWRKDFDAGGAARSLALGKYGAGATLMTAMTYAANAGICSGGGPVNDDLRKHKQELTGWKPYSCRIGDTWYAYDRLGAVGAMVGLVGDYAEIGGNLSEASRTEMAQVIIMAAMRNITSKTFAGGAADFLAAANGDEQAMTRFLSSTTSAAAIPGIMRQARRHVDPYQRETKPGASPDPEQEVWAEARAYMNRVKAQTPGYSKHLPPMRNALWGEPIELPSGWGVDGISPVYTSKVKKDPASDEVWRLMKLNLLRVGRVSRTVGGKDPEDHPIDMPISPLDAGVELTDGEYDERQRLAGNDVKDPRTGLGLHDEINRMVQDPKYLKESDSMKATIMLKTINTYRRLATAQLLENNKELRDLLEARQNVKAESFRPPASKFTPSGGGGIQVPLTIPKRGNQ